jgi:hypothetical protein
MIDPSLTHALKSDPTMLASWHQARRATVKPPVARAVSALSSPVVGGASVPVAPKPITLLVVPSVSVAVLGAHAPSTVPVAPESIAA